MAAETTLPPTDPLACNRELTFSVFNKIIQQLVARDRQLELAVVNFTSVTELQRTSALLDAVEVILGPTLVEHVIDNDLLPEGTNSYENLESDLTDRVVALEGQTTYQDTEGTVRSVKSLALNNQTNIAALNQKLDAFDAELDAVRAIIDDITAIKTTLDSQESRLADVETLLADVMLEVKNARREFSNDPAKRLIDKIDNLDARIEANVVNIRATIKEIVDARAVDRFDTLGERIGSLESGIEELHDLVDVLRGRGTVTGLKVGRSILHGDAELIPGNNIAITRERNGYRVDVVDMGTCVDLGAPKIDPNDGCCPPGNANFAN